MCSKSIDMEKLLWSSKNKEISQHKWSHEDGSMYDKDVSADPSLMILMTSVNDSTWSSTAL